MLRELVRAILTRYGSVVEFPRGRSFDFLYRDELRRLLIKTLKDVESLRRDLAEDIKRLSRTFECSPLIVSIKRRNERLMRGVTYIRHGLPVVSPETLEDALKGELPMFLDSRGGIRLFLSKEVFEKYSRNYLAEVLEVSKKAVYEYSRGLGVSASKAERIIEKLGEEAIERIDIFSRKVEPTKGEPKTYIDQKIAKLAEEFHEAFRLDRRPGRSALINEVIKVVFSTDHIEAIALHTTRRYTGTPAIFVGKSDEVPSVKPEELDKMRKDDLIELVS